VTSLRKSTESRQAGGFERGPPGSRHYKLGGCGKKNLRDGPLSKRNRTVQSMNPRVRSGFAPPFPGAPPRLTARAAVCSFPSQFTGHRVMNTGKFNRCKGLAIGDLQLSNRDVGEGELALKTFPGVPLVL
jgi:hypothetical protein